MSSKRRAVRVVNVDLELGVEFDITKMHERPGEREYTGSTDTTPDVAALRAQLASAGFLFAADYVIADSSGFSLCAYRLDRTTKRSEANVVVNFSGSPWNALFVNGVDRDALPEVNVTNGTFQWAGVAWPAYFTAGKVVSDSEDMFAIEAAVSPGIDIIASYRAWAREQGFEIEDPLNAWEIEPDMRVAVGLRFMSDRILVRLEVEEDGFISLSLSPRLD